MIFFHLLVFDEYYVDVYKRQVYKSYISSSSLFIAVFIVLKSTSILLASLLIDEPFLNLYYRYFMEILYKASDFLFQWHQMKQRMLILSIASRILHSTAINT